MASTLTGLQVSSGIVCQVTAPATGSHTSSTTVSAQSQVTPVIGSSAGQENKIYDASYSVASGSPLALTLNDGSLSDPLGAALTFTVINQIKIQGTDTTPGHDITPFGGTNGLLAVSTTLVYGGATPGSILFDFGTTGITIDGTHKIVQLAAAAGTVTGNITIVGR